MNAGEGKKTEAHVTSANHLQGGRDLSKQSGEATGPLLRATVSLSGLLDRSNETEIKCDDVFHVLE